MERLAGVVCLALISGCGGVDCRVSFVSEDPSSRVTVNVLDEQRKSTFYDEFDLHTKNVVEFQAQPGQQFSYGCSTPQREGSQRSITIPDTASWALELPCPRQLVVNEETALKELQGIAQGLHADKASSGRLVDFVPQLNQALIVDSKGSLLTGVPLGEAPVISFAPAMRFTTDVHVTNTTLANVAASIPLYASFASAVKEGELYRLSVDVSHYPIVSAFSLDEAVLRLEPTGTTIRALEKVCKDKTRRVRVLNRFHLIDSAVFELEKGRNRSTSADLDLTVVSGGMEYVFSQNERNTFTLSQIVLDVEYLERPCEDILALVESDKSSESPKKVSEAIRYQPTEDFLEQVRELFATK
ncbi:MAG: hypothetical protein RBU37_14280 [Myxococcota bacterium]|jgi:hypothetical protein|nr:hypothetical protein [Myxococcota bacterium]